MEIAYCVAIRGLQQKLAAEEILKNVKSEASFAGTMRQNLVAMLDGLELPRSLGIKSSSELFGMHRHLAQTTSAICFPVFVHGENYTGHSPNITKAPVFQHYLQHMLLSELQSAPDALIVPLGKSVSEVLEILITAKSLDKNRCLIGFPHPSGTLQEGMATENGSTRSSARGSPRRCIAGSDASRNRASNHARTAK